MNRFSWIRWLSHREAIGRGGVKQKEEEYVSTHAQDDKVETRKRGKKDEQEEEEEEGGEEKAKREKRGRAKPETWKLKPKKKLGENIQTKREFFWQGKTETIFPLLLW